MNSGQLEKSLDSSWKMLGSSMKSSSLALFYSRLSVAINEQCYIANFLENQTMLASSVIPTKHTLGNTWSSLELHSLHCSFLNLIFMHDVSFFAFISGNNLSLILCIWSPEQFSFNHIIMCLTSIQWSQFLWYTSIVISWCSESRFTLYYWELKSIL